MGALRKRGVPRAELLACLLCASAPCPGFDSAYGHLASEALAQVLETRTGLRRGPAGETGLVEAGGCSESWDRVAPGRGGGGPGAGNGLGRGPEVGRQQPRLPPPRQRVARGSLTPPLPAQVEPPELPEDLQHWIAYNEASSQLLRAESGLSDVGKDQ